VLDLAVSLDLGFDPADHGRMSFTQPAFRSPLNTDGRRPIG
jgi:hypothetical protein